MDIETKVKDIVESENIDPTHPVVDVIRTKLTELDEDSDAILEDFMNLDETSAGRASDYLDTVGNKPAKTKTRKDGLTNALNTISTQGKLRRAAGDKLTDKTKYKTYKKDK